MRVANLELIVGDDNMYDMTVRRNDLPIDLTFYDIKFVAKRHKNDADVDAIFNLDGEIVSAHDGVAMLFVPRAISDTLEEGILQYAVIFTDTDEDKVSTGAQGRLTVIKGVTY